MPKKWGVNDKKQAARDKEKREKEQKRAQEEEEKEHLEWKETDKHALKKLDRKQKAAEKKEAELKRKQEKKELYEKEMAELTKGMKEPKITQVEAQKIRQKVIDEAMGKEETKRKPRKNLDSSDEGEPIHENLNRVRAEEEEKLASEGIKVVSATGLVNAVKVLAENEPDRHPERRMKKAFEEYSNKMLPKVKAEYPGLKRSQYLNMINKEWKSAPENPMNGNVIAYNAKI